MLLSLQADFFFTCKSAALRRNDNDRSVINIMQEFAASKIRAVQESGLRCIRRSSRLSLTKQKFVRRYVPVL